MKIKNVVMVTAGLVFGVIIWVLISNCISGRNLPSVNLPVVSYEKEKMRQPAKALESKADKPVPKVEQKIEVEHKMPLTENEGLYQPVPEEEREIEVEYYEESLPDMSYDDALTGIGPEDEGAGLEDEENEITMEEGPPSPGTVSALPIFEPVISDTGPIAEAAQEDSKITDTEELPEVIEEYDYDGPPIPPDKESKPLPTFTPVTNKTGPTPVKSD